MSFGPAGRQHAGASARRGEYRPAASAALRGVVTARHVVERERELGIRAALGASRERIVALVMRQGGGLVPLGVAAGVAGALALARLMRGLLFGVAPDDPITIGTVSALLAGTALLAVFLPARRAAWADAMAALRRDG